MSYVASGIVQPNGLPTRGHGVRSTDGQALCHYPQLQRLEQTTALRREDWSQTVAAIARRFGFKNLSHFSARFRRMTEMSPKGMGGEKLSRVVRRWCSTSLRLAGRSAGWVDKAKTVSDKPSKRGIPDHLWMPVPRFILSDELKKALTSL